MEGMCKSSRAFSRRSFLGQFMGGVAGGLAASAFGALNLGCSLPPQEEGVGEQGESGEKYWNRIRSRFLIEPGLTFLNNGSLGPSPREVLQSVIESMEMLDANPIHNYWQVLLPRVEEVRKKISQFAGAHPEEIALTRNTTEGMNIVASGLSLRRGDEVLTTDQEHPGGRGCWEMLALRDGIVIKKIALPTPLRSPDQVLNLFNEGISKKTRIISVSHITFTTGTVLPVKELCRLAHERGVLIVLDGAHPLGMIELNLHDIDPDFYASSPHKWLLAPKGTGLLYVKKGHEKTLWPNVASAGWNDTSSAKRYEDFGTVNPALLVGLGEAIQFQNSIGKERIEKRGRMLAAALKEGVQKIRGVRLLTPMDEHLSAAIAAFTVEKGSSRDLSDYLWNTRRIATRIVEDIGLNALRLSTHMYNTLEEVEKALRGIEEFVRKTG